MSSNGAIVRYRVGAQWFTVNFGRTPSDRVRRGLSGSTNDRQRHFRCNRMSAATQVRRGDRSGRHGRAVPSDGGVPQPSVPSPRCVERVAGAFRQRPDGSSRSRLVATIGRHAASSCGADPRLGSPDEERSSPNDRKGLVTDHGEDRVSSRICDSRATDSQSMELDSINQRRSITSFRWPHRAASVRAAPTRPTDPATGPTAKPQLCTHRLSGPPVSSPRADRPEMDRRRQDPKREAARGSGGQFEAETGNRDLRTVEFFGETAKPLSVDTTMRIIQRHLQRRHRSQPVLELLHLTR